MSDFPVTYTVTFHFPYASVKVGADNYQLLLIKGFIALGKPFEVDTYIVNPALMTYAEIKENVENKLSLEST